MGAGAVKTPARARPLPDPPPHAGEGRVGVFDWLPVALFAALPTVGLFAGPAYAALVFGFGLAQLLGSAMGRRMPRPALPLLCFAAAFAALGWASLLWSIAPRATSHGALQLSAVFAAALLVLAAPPPAPRVLDPLCRAAAIAVAIGAAILFLDAATGFHLQALLSRDTADIPAKYNRGADYLAVLLWPVAAWAAARRERAMLALVFLAAGLALFAAPSVTGRVAALVGLGALLFAFLSPRLALGAIAAATALIAAATPFLLHALAQQRGAIAARLLVTPHLKLSGLARLEIWDYMTARIFERPLLGWGLWSAKFVPVGAGQASAYRYAGLGGNYPHDQWLQAWLETGALGAAIALLFALFVLRRIARAPQAARPFACAAFAAALTISLSNYDVATDSWWAAIAACAYLFAALAATKPANR